MIKRKLTNYNRELINFADIMKANGFNNQSICRWFNVNHCKFSLIKNGKDKMTRNFKILLTFYVNRVESVGVKKAIVEIQKLNNNI